MGNKLKRPTHYAEFEFRPTYDWSKEEAFKLYQLRFRQFQLKLINPIKLNQVYFEDCISGMKRIPENSIDLIIADPPFGISYTGKNNGNYRRKKEYVLDGYREVLSQNYHEFTKKWISQLPRILKEGGSTYIFSGYNHLHEILNELHNINFHQINHLIWKYQFPPFCKSKFATTKYHLLYFVKNPQKRFFNRIQFYEKDVWEINRPYFREKEKNGTKLPEALIEKIIGYSSRPGDIILDPFMGNGTTGIVAKKQFRNFIGFELNHQAQDLIQRNLDVPVGETYTPYTERIPAIEELAQRPGYNQAYLQYCQMEGD